MGACSLLTARTATRICTLCRADRLQAAGAEAGMADPTRATANNPSYCGQILILPLVLPTECMAPWVVVTKPIWSKTVNRQTAREDAGGVLHRR